MMMTALPTTDTASTPNWAGTTTNNKQTTNKRQQQKTTTWGCFGLAW